MVEQQGARLFSIFPFLKDGGDGDLFSVTHIDLPKKVQTKLADVKKLGDASGSRILYIDMILLEKTTIETKESAGLILLD